MVEEEQDVNIIKIQGYSVCFPKGKKPFAPQLALMSKLLLGLRKGENCALESPTGTGKSIAVLSAALAWQNDQKRIAQWVESDSEEEPEVVVKEEVKGRKPLRSFQEFEYVDDSVRATAAIAAVEAKEETAERRKEKGKTHVELDYEHDEDEDNIFQVPKKKRKKKKTVEDGKSTVINKMDQNRRESSVYSPSTGEAGPNSGDVGHPAAFSNVKAEAAQQSRSPSSGAEQHPSVESVSGELEEGVDVVSVPGATVKTEEASAKEKMTKRKPKRRQRVAPIILATRTLSQVNQLVGEVRTCNEADTRAVGIDERGKPFSMTLLSSRKHTCINKKACNDPKGVDAACKRLVKDGACCYKYQRRSRFVRPPTPLPTVWDVEDAIHFGKSNQTCPYYMARDYLPSADLVLCPYNYLIDPAVREVSGMNIKGAVLIFDEAHNLEDTAREAASAKLSLGIMSSAADEMELLEQQSRSTAPAYALLRYLTADVQAFLEEAAGALPLGGYEKAHKIYRGEEALGLMQSRAGVTAESLVQLKQALDTIMSDPAGGGDEEEQACSEESTQVLSGPSLGMIVALVKVLGFLITEGMENVEHYKMVVLRERAPWQPTGSGGRRGRARGGSSAGADGVFGAMETYLCFWCQSASVCFSEVDKQAHSIVLTSGTLSPLDSFAGELGVQFPHRLEAPHVINVAKQCLVTSVGYFSGVSLDSRYTNQNDLKYQDSLGNALLQYARVVPGGILSFFPSYGLMEKMHDRWKAIGLLKALESIKAVYVEPRGQGKIERVLSDYYTAIRTGKHVAENQGGDSTQEPHCHTGALMLAVARGKVSEGIDFSDEAARMCIIIGIPFPSSKDIQVMLKKEYQDRRRQKNPELVGGKAWYELQAFRAVNQAVGRCIRHRNDFGAIVLCDPRYSSQPETTANLSKWVRSSVKHCRSVEASLHNVNAFFRHHEATDESASAVVGAGADGVVGTGCPPKGCGASGGCGDERSKCGHDGRHGSTGKDVVVGPPEIKPEKNLVQQTLAQAFRSSVRTAATNNCSHSAIDSNNDSVSYVRREKKATISLATDDYPAGPQVHRSRIDASLTRPGRTSLICLGGMERELAHAPDDSSGGRGDEPSCPRRVVVRRSSYLMSNVCDEVGMTKAELVEVPKDWVVLPLEEPGQWVAEDGMVYAPLRCYCCNCISQGRTVGVKVLAAGLHGEDLVGRAWFVPQYVRVKGIELSATRDIMLPTQFAELESLRSP